MSAYHEPLAEDKLMARTILLVEDDVGIGEIMRDAFREEGPYRVMFAPDGFEALRIVGRFKPHLFVLDYRLPGMNGIELYDRLHATDGLENVPALFVSAGIPSRELEKRHLRSIDKPFELDQLLQTVRQLLVA